MSESENIAQLRIIKNALLTFEPKIRQRMLWYLLSVHLAGDVNGINWLLKELEIFLDNESGKLLRPFQ